MTNVAIVGAGPYGLSLAAHLQNVGVPFQVFGQPMQFWLQVAKGANDRYLKSFGFATNVYTPKSGYTFVEYNQRHGLESFEPCAIRDFANYGVWVQEQLLPGAKKADVVKISEVSGGYRVVASNGDQQTFERVVVATGLSNLAVLPEKLRRLPRSVVSHTSEIAKFDTFANRDVCILGAGQSALEAAMLLQQAGARPRLIVRGPKIAWNQRYAGNPSLWRKLRSPLNELGASPKSWLLTKFPAAMHFAPEKWRLQFLDRHLPAEGAWWLRDQVEREVPIDLDCEVVSAKEKDGRVALRVKGAGAEREILCDHVVSGTGYEVDVDRLSFLDEDIRARVTRIDRAPRLDRHFETSMSGLHFLGPSSAPSFGPLFRFVAGASYAAPMLAKHIAGRQSTRVGSSAPVSFSRQG